MGASGLAVSTVKVRAVVGSEILPLVSVATTVMLCRPLDNGVPVGIWKVQPVPLTIAVPISTPLSKTLTIEPASTTPLSSG